jgi:hypothetical protein
MESCGILMCVRYILPEGADEMKRSKGLPRDPLPEAAWEVWYRDTFDRECPPSVDVRGHGLVKGLVELWARHLFETVRPNGNRGFSRFHLHWEGRRAIAIEGNWQGATRLRQWVFVRKTHSRKGYIKEGDARLLEQIAITHARLLLASQPEEQILAAAAAAADRQDFEARLLDLSDVQLVDEENGLAAASAKPGTTTGA